MNKSKIGSLISAIIPAILGIILILNPYGASAFLIQLLGVGLLLLGAGTIISALIKGNFQLSSVANLIGNVCIIILGLICLFNSGFIIRFINIIFGVIILLHGVSLLLNAIEIRQTNIVPLILSILSIVLGILVLTGVFGAAVIRITGIILLYNAVLALWVGFKS